MTIHLSHPDLAQTVGALRRTSDSLEQSRASTERQVDCLLDGGWSGAAAAAYGEGWQEWRAGCREVLASLAVMIDLVVAAGADLDTADVTSRDVHEALQGRVAERLG